MDIKDVLARNVREIREQRGWSQEELGDLADVHRTYVSQVERGIRNPTIEIVARLAKALKVSAADLLQQRR